MNEPITATYEVRGVKWDVEWSYEGDSHDDLDICLESVRLHDEVNPEAQTVCPNLLGFLNRDIVDALVGHCYTDAENDYTERLMSIAEGMRDALRERV